MRLPRLVWLLMFIPFSLGAMDPMRWGAPVANNFTPEVYQADLQNWTAIQDKRGVMYFANSKGILEYDGIHWKLITPPGNVLVRGLAQDASGTIYWGSVGEFGTLRPTPSGDLEAISLSATLPEKDRAFSDVWEVLAGRDGVYFLTWSHIFRLHQGRVERVAGRISSSQSGILNGIPVIMEASQGPSLLLDGRVIPLFPKGAWKVRGRTCITQYGPHELLVGDTDGTFQVLDLAACWDGTSYDPTRLPAKGWARPFSYEVAAEAPIKRSWIYKLRRLDDQTFAMTTIKGGLVILDRHGRVLRVLNELQGLIDNTALDAMMDRNGDLWVCTNSGISHVELSLPHARFDQRHDLKGVAISAAHHGGRFYVGTFQELLVLTTETGSLARQRGRFVPLQNGGFEIWELQVIEGDLLAASSGGLLNIKDLAVTPIHPGTAINGMCLATSRRFPGHVFMGSMGSISVYQKKNGAWSPLGLIRGLSGTIRLMAEDGEGHLWALVHGQGVRRLVFHEKGPMDPHIQAFGPEQGLPAEKELGLATHHDGLLYLSSKEGLYRLEALGKAPRFVPETTYPALLPAGSSTPQTIGFAPDGSVWIGTEKESYRAVPRPGGGYRLEDQPFRGTRSMERLALLEKNGRIWFGGQGLLGVDPGIPKDYDSPYQALVRGVVTEERRDIFLGSGQFRPPVLPYRENALIFTYAAPFFEKAGTLRYQVRLEGFEGDWGPWSPEVRKEYTNLREGSYRFVVRAKNVHGVVSKEDVFSFRILPPWYRTWWAWLLWVCGVLGLMTGVSVLVTWRLRRQKAVLEKLVAKRTEQLREATLTDPLTGLRNRRFISEILQTDLDAFIQYWNHLLSANNRRRPSMDEAVFGIFMLDLDHFKRVNDNHGHEGGDQVLRDFAQILRTSARTDDAVLRMGGEEFLVVLKKTDPAYMEAYAAKLLERIARHSFPVGGGKSTPMTCSIGFVSFPFTKEHPGCLNFEQILMLADLALYHAKHTGRNRAVQLSRGEKLEGEKELELDPSRSLEALLDDQLVKILTVIEGPKID